MRASVPLLLIGTLFVWAGMVAGISFLEAPLKFTAPHISVALGVGIGRVVFQALNKVEIGLCALAVGAAMYARVPRQIGAGVAGLGALLLLQTFWLLPALDVRAEALLAGHAPAATFLHPLYIGVEAGKLLLLLTLGALAYRHLTRPVKT